MIVTSIRHLRQIPCRILRQVIRQHTVATPGYWQPIPRSRAALHLWLTDGWGQVLPQYRGYFTALPEVGPC